MRSRTSSRFMLIAVALAATTLAALGLAVTPGPTSLSRQATVSREELPPAVARRFEQLRRAIPGNEGMSPEGPGGYDEQRWMARAYPGEDIPLAYLEEARAAAAAVRARGVGPGKNAPGSWFLMGPTSAVYQSTRYRFSYVPSQYEAAGRVTALAIAPTCRAGDCRLLMGAASGGVWRTRDAMAGSPQWEYLSPNFGANAIGSIAVDPNDPTGNTVWVGTGESHASADSAAGVGLYKSTDGGSTWSDVIGSSYFAGRAVAGIAVHPTNPDILYIASARGVRGIASTGGATSNVPGAQPYGLWKSTDGGATFTFLHNGTALGSDCYPNIKVACGVRGVNSVALDPSNPDIVYAGTYGRGVWRSNDGGSTWTQIKAPLTTASDMRPDLAVTSLGAATRMYVAEGASGSPYSRLYRSDDVAAGAPVFTDLTSPDPGNPGYGSYDFCGGQCWYDIVVFTPKGYPDIVYLGGSYQYGEPYSISNGRSVVLSTDAGVTFTDMTKDATGNLYPNGLHPDHHALVVHPGNPFLFFSGSDGGVMRSSGLFDNVSDQCSWRRLSPTVLARCQQLLSRVPSRLEAINRGLATLQFYSLSVDPTNVSRVMGGTQDNGTFQTSGSPTYWKQTFWGDGGQSGFDVAMNGFRFHTFYYPSPDVNFENGAIHDWNWIADRIYASEPTLFYPPIISDPVMSRWMWVGTQHVWRTKTHGMGNLPLQAFRDRCNEFTGDFTIYCGDWEPLGAAPYSRPDAPPPSWAWPPSPGRATRLTYGPCGNVPGTDPPVPACPGPYQYGTDRAGGSVSRVARASDGHTLWASTSAGRLFISSNADAEPYSAVIFTRIDPLASNDPARFISGIYVDPSNANRAWVSYSGYNQSTPNQPGHLFEVVYNPATTSATWTAKDGSGATGIGNQPVNDVAYDAVTGDLYVATDFAVLRAVGGGVQWTIAASGMPNAEVSALTIVTKARKLFAATHGLGAWSLALK